MSSLPPDFIERLQLQFPDQVEAILPTFTQRPPVVRVNTLLTTMEQAREVLESKGFSPQEVPLLPTALLVPDATRRDLTDLPEYEQGWFYIQSIASQLAVAALDPQPGETIMDMCSAPGSKTSQIAIAMAKQGELLANDNNRKRIYRLHRNLEHQQVGDFVEVKNYSGQNYPKFYPDHFDRILVDAPCSSEARFDPRYPKSIHFWSRHKVKSMAKTQKRLLSAALQCVKPGGLVVYSTCTLSPEENEQVLEKVLSKHPDVAIEALEWDIPQLPVLREWKEKALSDSLQGAVRLMPSETTEAFFIARLRRRDQ